MLPQFLSLVLRVRFHPERKIGSVLCAVMSHIVSGRHFIQCLPTSGVHVDSRMSLRQTQLSPLASAQGSLQTSKGCL